MKKLFLLILCIQSISSFAASGGAGNGGDVIVCPNRDMRVMLLDYYEAQKMRLTIDLSDPKIHTQTLRSMVNVAVSRLRQKDQYTASLLYDYAMEMVNDFEKFELYPDARGKNVYLGYDIIAEINDSEHVSTPEGCEEHPRQLVSQKAPKFRYEFRYEISKSLWEQMDLLNQSMTILHEAWYRIMLENGATNSRGARYMNALVASKEFESYSFADYLKELKETELQYYVVINKSEAVKTQEIQIDLKNHILEFGSAEVCAPNFIVNLSLKETYSLLNRSQRYVQNIKMTNVCFENSHLTKIELPKNVLNTGYTLRLPFIQLEFDKATNESPALIFHNNGKMSHFEGVQFSSLMEMYYLCNGSRSFDENRGCEAGPFINHETKINDPIDIKFDLREKLLAFFE